MDQNRLTHHEQLRYDYLFKNYHYLNEREKEELAYLMDKREGKDQVTESVSSPSFEATSSPLKTPPTSTSSRTRRKRRLKKPFKRFIQLVLILVILTLSGMLFMFIRGLQLGNQANPKASQTEVFHGRNTKDGVNILIMGTDGRIGQTSGETRTDTIMVLNVGNKEGKIKLASFMRDTLVHIDGVSKEDGYHTYYDQKINVAYSIGEQNNHQGAELVRSVLQDMYGLDIKYYALVDFATFASAIDSLFPNGVEMDAQFSTVDGQAVTQVEVPDDLNMKNGVVPEQTIEVGKQRMDGRTLLNYARFRKDDEGDFGRARRQQEVLTAIMTQIKDPSKLFTGSEALGKVFAMTSTNIPYSFLLTKGVGILTSGQKGMERITVPENGDWEDEYDMYGGLGILVDFEKYKEKLAQLGF